MITDLLEILGIFLAALLAAQFGFIQQRRGQNHDRNLQFRRDRFELYQKFFDACNKLVAAAKLGQRPYDQARSEFLYAYEGLRLITTPDMLRSIREIHKIVGEIDIELAGYENSVDHFNSKLGELVKLARDDLGVGNDA